MCNRGHRAEKTISGNCKSCVAIYNEKWRKKNPKYFSDRAQKDPDRILDNWQRWYKNKTQAQRDLSRIRSWNQHGIEISLSKYNNLKRFQQNKCAICKKTESRSLSVDHNHRTGKIRGLVCRKCNLILGNAEDSTRVLTSAIRYLKIK